MRKISLIVYDFDGTLVDTLIDITDSVNLTLADLSLPQLPRERIRTVSYTHLTLPTKA